MHTHGHNHDHDHGHDHGHGSGHGNGAGGENYAARPHPEHVVLDIGGDFGALIVHTDAGMHRRRGGDQRLR